MRVYEPEALATDFQLLPSLTLPARDTLLAGHLMRRIT